MLKQKIEKAPNEAERIKLEAQEKRPSKVKTRLHVSEQKLKTLKRYEILPIKMTLRLYPIDRMILMMNLWIKSHRLLLIKL